VNTSVTKLRDLNLERLSIASVNFISFAFNLKLYSGYFNSRNM
jgi:hypothetical protein